MKEHRHNKWSYLDENGRKIRTEWKNISTSYLIKAFEDIQICTVTMLEKYFITSPDRNFATEEFRIELELRGYFKEQERIKKLEMI